ncbi:MAG: MOSC domain-containing protein [Gammaproteobacteria bacterium]|nr:MOSC domain-containing protein [Gammaproteobacteria bacterium]
MSASIVSIHIASESGSPLLQLSEASLVAGKGIAGDRNFRQEGARPDRQITLIEEEKVAEFNRESGLTMQADQTRRNLVTRGVDLNRLVGKRFRVGQTLLEGMDLCQPCAGLGALHANAFFTQVQVVKGMVDRGGLRASIILGGTVHPGDAISVED